MRSTSHSRALAVLTLCAFTFGTGEIMIAGLLPDIAASVEVSLSTAGLLMSVFAATVVVGGPVLSLLAGRVRRRRMVVALMLVFVAGNATAAASSSFALLAAGRIAAALAHAALLPVFFAVAADVAPPGRQGSAVARVSLGFSLAMIAGLPLGTALGHWLGWRAAFWAMAALAAVALALVAPIVPDTAAGGSGGRAAELRVLADRRVQTVIAVTALGAAGAFTAYTFVTPLLNEVAGFGSTAVTVLLLLFGVGGTVGGLAGGRLADRSVTGSIVAGMAALAVSLLGLGLLAGNRASATVFLLLFGAAYYAVIPAVNTRMIEVASDRARTLALTLQSSAFNLGIAVGGWFGGRVIDGGPGLRWTPVAGAVVAAVGLAVVAAAHRWSKTVAESPQSAATPAELGR
ncbi:MFS transporter [Actinomadura harenae]|uniref:MFS transporter n=1 Tax=Actinomadura harenae TaxID=2483351 RepID=A0A3M2L428_9ACTN|nr:MFS transporter [Actinomadura harenae]RMI32469.1 MFS transporter [Actinomadura harenae]